MKSTARAGRLGGHEAPAKRRAGRPERSGDGPGNRVREIRLDREFSLDELAERCGLTKSALSRIETGETLMNVDHMRRLAVALDVGEEQLLASSARPREVKVVGYVGAGAEIYPIDEDPDGLRSVSCPDHLDPASTVAVEVRGDSMFPIVQDGWLLFYSRRHEAVPSQLVGALSIVHLEDGRTLVKHVRRGPSKGHFNLISANAAPIEDVKLRWAARVRAILPPR